MCGRFTLRLSREVIAKAFGLLSEIELAPRYNIAPTQDVAAVRSPAGQPRQLSLLRWGLVPSWAKSLAVGNTMINARAETIASKPAFRKALTHRRCLIPVDGFYEWQKPSKQPYFIHRPNGELFAFAGLWERWQDVESCTIITRAANEQMASLHDRMPVALPAVEWDNWLDPNQHDPRELERILASEPLSLVAEPVSRYVSNARNQGPQCLEPA
jgi:putative SOS response-associated peptidase YedK